jgi:hypothetical protein
LAQAPSYVESLGIDGTLARELIDLVTAQPGMNTTAIKKAIGGNAYRIGDELARLEVDGKSATPSVQGTRSSGT